MQHAPFERNADLYFEMSDIDGRNAIEINEFKRIVEILEYKISDSRVQQLYKFYGNKDQMNIE